MFMTEARTLVRTLVMTSLDSIQGSIQDAWVKVVILLINYYQNITITILLEIRGVLD